MTFPSVADYLEQGFSSASTSHLVNLPATVNNNDLLIVAAASNETTFGAVSGWTELYDLTSLGSSGQAQAGCWVKVADGTEGGTTVDIPTDSSRRVAAQVYRITGWSGDINDVEFATAKPTGGTSNAPPSITASWGSDDNLFLVFAHCADDDETFSGYPTNYTDGDYIVSGGGTNNGCEIGSARRELASASDTPDNFTLSQSENWVTATLVIRPGEVFTTASSIPRASSSGRKTGKNSATAHNLVVAATIGGKQLLGTASGAFVSAASVVGKRLIIGNVSASIVVAPTVSGTKTGSNLTAARTTYSAKASGKKSALGNTVARIVPKPRTTAIIPKLSQVAYRDYATFLSFTVGETVYRWATVAQYRNGGWYAGNLATFIDPSDAFSDEFGIVAEDRVRVSVVDPDNDYDFNSLIDSIDGIAADIELLTTRHRADGTTQELSYTRQATISAPGREPGVLTFDLVDLDRAFLENTYPTKRFTVADFPELFIEHDGLPVPIVVGTALHVPFVYGKTNAGIGPWVYYGPENIGSPSVLTVYRDGRIVNSSEYTAATEVVGSTTYLKLTFTAEQVDFNGNVFSITADIFSSQSRNVATELERILTAAGVTTTAFPTTLATSESMLVDIGYVDPRTFAAIVQDLLLIARGNLYRNSNGEWDLIQDQARAIDATYDEDARDALEVRSYQKARRNKTVELEYRPIDSRNLSDLKHLLTRDTGAALGTKRFISPYLWDHTAADKLHSYLSKKEATLAGADAVVHDAQIGLGNILSLSNSLLYSGAKSFIAERISRSEDANDLELREYDATIYTYSAGTLPSDATNGYQPDFSLTPPAAPMGLQVISQSVELDADGKAIAHAQVEATPPSVNYEYLEFWATDDTTGELYYGRGQDNGDGTWGTTLAGLKLNRAHTLFSVAVNANSVKGTAASVGFTSASYGTTPPTPATIDRNQGPGKSIRITWAEVAISNLKHYELQRNSVFVTFFKGTEYVDQNVSYGTNYTYRVRAIDQNGNIGGFRTASAINIGANLANPDLTANSVANPQLQSSSVSSGNVQTAAIQTDKIPVGAVTESFNVSGGAFSLTHNNLIRFANLTVSNSQGGGGDIIIMIAARVGFDIATPGHRAKFSFLIRRNSIDSFWVPDFLECHVDSVDWIWPITFTWRDTPAPAAYQYEFYLRQDGDSSVTADVLGSFLQITVLRR